MIENLLIRMNGFALSFRSSTAILNRSALALGLLTHLRIVTAPVRNVRTAGFTAFYRHKFLVLPEDALDEKEFVVAKGLANKGGHVLISLWKKGRGVEYPPM